MARKHAVLVAAAGLTMLLSTAACAAGNDAPVPTTPERGAVGLAMPTKKMQRWIADGENMVKQFELLGYQPDLQFADDDIQLQVSQIEKMIERGDKALVIGAIDGTALKGVLAKAAAAKIPVISYDRLIRDSSDISYYATFDNFKVGVLQGNYLIKTLGLDRGKGPFNIELFAGSPDDNNATFFFNGAMSVLKPYLDSGKLVVRSGETAFKIIGTPGWNPDISNKRMARILASTYSSERLDVVLAPNDGLARGIIEALKAAGYGTGDKPLPVTTGQDAELDSVKLVASGVQGQTIYKDTRELAKVAVQMTNSLLTGGSPEINDTKQYHNGVKVVPTFLLQPISVDKSNYHRILVEGGYYSAAEIGG